MCPVAELVSLQQETRPGTTGGTCSPRRPGGPDRTWLTGIAEHPTGEGKLYVCAIKDVYSNRIVGYSMGSRMTAGLAVSALRNAIALRSPAGTVVAHSDGGSQYRSVAYVRTLRSCCNTPEAFGRDQHGERLMWAR